MQSSISKASTNFFLGTLISRFSGMFRDIFLAFFFGSSASLATFMVAFRFVHLFRRFLGEAALQGGFVFHFESLEKKDAAILYRDLFFTIGTALFLGIFFLEAAVFFIKDFFPFLQNPFIKYFFLMLFGIIFLSLYGLNSSLLKCQKIYFLPAMAPSMFNLVWIIALWAIYFFSYPNPFILLSTAIVIAFFSQMMVTFFPSFVFFIQHHRKKDFFRPKLFSSQLKGLIKPFSLSIIGIGAVQLNTALDGIFAKIASEKGPAYLWYAARLYQAPIGLFAVAINSAILPLVVRAFLKNDQKEYNNLIEMGVKKSIFFMVFINFGIFIFGISGINLVFARGAFDMLSTVNVAKCLYGYSISLVFVSLVFIFSSALYAKKAFAVVMRGSVYSVILNIFLNILFVIFFKKEVCYIAIATSLSAVFNVFYLYRYLNIPLSIFRYFLKIVSVSILSCFVVFFLGYFLWKDPMVVWFLDKSVIFPREFFLQMKSFFSLFCSYIFLFFLFGYFFKIISLKDMKKYLFK